MTNSDGSSVGIQLGYLVGAHAQLAYTVDDLTGKCLVNLDDIEVLDAHARSGQDFLGCRHRANAHDRGVNAHHHRMSEGAHRFVAQLLCFFLGHQQYRSGAITSRA